MSLKFAVSQALPTNVVRLAYLDGDLTDLSNSTSAEYPSSNKLLPTSSFLSRISYGIIMNEAKSEARLGVGSSSLLSNDALITNVISDPRTGVTIPLYYKYEIENLDIVMPIDQVRYDYLFSSASTPDELAELSSANDLIKSSLIERINFLNIDNEKANLSFNLKADYLSSNIFNITIYIEDSSRVIGSLYVVYKKSNSFLKTLIRSSPIHERASWSRGSVLFEVAS